MTTEEFVARFIIRSGLQDSWKVDAKIAKYAQQRHLDLSRIEQIISIMNELEN